MIGEFYLLASNCFADLNLLFPLPSGWECRTLGMTEVGCGLPMHPGVLGDRVYWETGRNGGPRAASYPNRSSREKAFWKARLQIQQVSPHIRSPNTPNTHDSQCTRSPKTPRLPINPVPLYSRTHPVSQCIRSTNTNGLPISHYIQTQYTWVRQALLEQI